MKKSAADRLRHTSSKPLLFFGGGFLLKVELGASPKNSTFGFVEKHQCMTGESSKPGQINLEMKLNQCE